MSPFTCSLLALAAMLATATAKGYCASEHLGHITGTPIVFKPVTFDPPGAEFTAPPIYCPAGQQVVGEDILACNNLNGGPAPSIDGPALGSWSPFTVMCTADVCPFGGTVYVTQYCDYF